MKWLYHKTHEPRIFKTEEVQEALSSGWAISPNDALKQVEPPAKKKKLVEAPVEKPKFLSQMNVADLHDEGKKYGIVFTDETRSRMRTIISKARK